MTFPVKLAFVTLLSVLWILAAPAWAEQAIGGEGAFPGLTENAPELDRLHSLVIAVDGETVYARAFRGPGIDQPVNIKSLSKTVLSAVVGMAIERGVFSGTGQPVADILDVPAGASDRIGEVTIGHLLSMQAGLQRTSGQYYGPWVNSDNWVDYALSRPFVAEPGGEMLYSTGSYHLLSAALTTGTGRSTLAVTRDWLGDPLGADIPAWLTDPQGVYFGGNDMQLSPMALLKLGELYRNGGVHDGEQILSRDWIDQSWTERGRSRYTDDRYGYGWFMTDLGGHRGYYGRGYGGQMLYVFPDLGMTVVMTSDPQPPASPSFMQKQNALLEEFVIPVLSPAPASASQNSQAQR
ncbi:serine hydrolase domain-containing protein [Marinobacter confluentis]|uniref:Class C beta-lactamase-related serine hydrolase n=1 Tax=Marinobacter confluentis TaxID=1697557 RepID=A0A4Z1C259_9GAMM|nr:serine hydrolase [Marinobacter confluentis]TGN40221.1 class C beta-lactamase-related serine hydrolase [Marinobacter confluentis]